jgi:DnaK suppressor protein
MDDSDHGPDPVEQDRPAAESIAEARANTERLIASLTRQLGSIVEAAALTTNDDEHDPEGVTVAFERAQVQSMLRQARTELDDLDRATERLRAGRYAVCERCGGPIAAARLAARPAARTCIDCANRAR